MTENEHAGPHRQGCPLRDGGGLAAAVASKALRKVAQAWRLEGPDDDYSQQHGAWLFRQLRRIEREFAAADEPSDPPKCICRGWDPKQICPVHSIGSAAPSEVTPALTSDERMRGRRAGSLPASQIVYDLTTVERIIADRAPTGGTDAGGLAAGIALTEDEGNRIRAAIAAGYHDHTADVRVMVEVQQIVAAHVEALRDSGRAADGGQL